MVSNIIWDYILFLLPFKSKQDYFLVSKRYLHVAEHSWKLQIVMNGNCQKTKPKNITFMKNICFHEWWKLIDSCAYYIKRSFNILNTFTYDKREDVYIWLTFPFLSIIIIYICMLKIHACRVHVNFKILFIYQNLSIWHNGEFVS